MNVSPILPLRRLLQQERFLECQRQYLESCDAEARAAHCCECRRLARHPVAGGLLVGGADAPVLGVSPRRDTPSRSEAPTAARTLDGTNFVVDQRFRELAVRDGRLITGQQQFSGAAAARLVIETLGL